jgi:phosphate-selective porin OprO/OprP
MKSKLVCVGLLACCTPALAAQAPNLFGVPTEYGLPSGFKFGAEGVYQYDFNDFSNDAIDPTNGSPLFDDAHAWDRKELDLYAKWSNGFEIDAGYDWNRSWTDNYIEYSSKKFGDFRVGQMRAQVGWEPMEGAQTWTFLTPGLPDKAIFEDRRVGADWSYGGLRHWLFQVQYFWGSNLDGKFPGHTTSARVVFNPVKSKKEVVHIGVAVSREHPSDHMAHFHATPEASLTKTYLVDTQPLPFTNAIDRGGLELGFMGGPFYAQGEYLALAAHRDNGLPEFRGHGFYVLGAWMLTGDTPRTYKDGEFDLPKPTHKYGALELAARYSELDLSDGIVQGGREHDWTIGLNWYFKNLKVMGDYVWAHANHSPVNFYVASIDPRIFEVRAQISFGP